MRSRVWSALSAVAAVGLLAACDRESARPTVDRTDGATATASAPAAAPAPAQADFVGVWAATPEQCHRNETWRITADRLAAAGGVTCAIEGAARSASGWAVQARCAGTGAPQAASLAFSAPTAEGAMTVSGGPFAPAATLVRCTPPLTGG